VPFLGGGFYDIFPIFSYLRGISVGALSESKMLKMSGHVLYGNPKNWVRFIIKRAGHSGAVRCSPFLGEGERQGNIHVFLERAMF
jgi:hypothetical protein